MSPWNSNLDTDGSIQVVSQAQWGVPLKVLMDGVPIGLRASAVRMMYGGTDVLCTDTPFNVRVFRFVFRTL